MNSTTPSSELPRSNWRGIPPVAWHLLASHVHPMEAAGKTGGNCRGHEVRALNWSILTRSAIVRLVFRFATCALVFTAHLN
jgi:hypothetical protein